MRHKSPIRLTSASSHAILNWPAQRFYFSWIGRAETVRAEDGVGSRRQRGRSDLQPLGTFPAPAMGLRPRQRCRRAALERAGVLAFLSRAHRELRKTLSTQGVTDEKLNSYSCRSECRAQR